MIQRLSSKDHADFRAMQRLYAIAFEDKSTYQSKPPSEAYITDVLSQQNVIALVAKNDDLVIGALSAYVLQKFEQERSEIYIYDLAVAADHRRQGVATALIAEIQQIASQVGAWVSFVQADHGDEPAIALYSRYGAREDVLHFDIPPVSTKGST